MKRTFSRNAWQLKLGTCATIVSFSLVSLQAQNQYINGFGLWKSDDTRDGSGLNLAVDGITNFPVYDNPADPLEQEQQIGEQINWRQLTGSRGNLGGLYLDGGTSGGQKSTLSFVDASTGFGSTTAILSEDLSVSYRWTQTGENGTNQGAAFRMAIQSNLYESPTGAIRSGEGAWDLILTAPAGGKPGSTTVVGLDYENTTWNIYQRAGATTFGSIGAVVTGVTLSDLKSGNFVMNDPLLNTPEGRANLQAAIFGTEGTNNAKVTNVQFGIGSGQTNGEPVIDWARMNFINDGELLDFVDASTWAGGSSGDFTDPGNWTNGDAPSATQNVVFAASGTRNVAVNGAVEARSIGAGNGETTLALGENTTLSLRNDGYLSAEAGARLTVTGTQTSLVTAAAVEAWGSPNSSATPGTVEISTNVQLDGGSVNHPARGGRYALVVGAGGEVVLKAGADVSIENQTAQTIVRVAENDGDNTSEGVLRIEGGRLQMGRMATGAQGKDATIAHFQVGDWGSNGRVAQSDGEVELIGALNIGNQGGHGLYQISAGSLKLGVASVEGVHDGYGALNTLGRNASTGTVRPSYGRMEISGTGLVELAKGSLIIGNNINETSTNNNGGRGEIIQTGGTLRVGSEGALFLSGFRHSSAVDGVFDGVYELNGGALEIGGNSLRERYNNTTGQYAFRLGGGTLRVIGSKLTTSVNASLKAGTESYIDTAEAGADWSGSFTGEGKLAKLGAHTLTLTGNSRITGELHVLEGAIQQTAGTNSISEYGVGTGTGKVGVAGISNGVLNIETLTEDLGNPGEFIKTIGRFQVGNWGGTGTFDQTGGVVNVFGALNIGNQGGKGTYNLSSGTLNLVSGTYGVGRTENSTLGGEGELNISGNALLDLAHGDFIIGDYSPLGATATGVVNQTGGTFRVASGGGTNAVLFLGGYGGGTYNLDDGTLEIGANRLVGNYGAATGGYQFNLRGGTIKVIGAALDTKVDAALSNVSTIDTNGLGAVWKGTLSGTGGLKKTGEGVLTLAATNTYEGATSVEAGTLNVSGTTGTGAVTVGTAGTLAGNGLVQGQATIAGALQPGNSPGTLTFAAGLTLTSSSTTTLEVDGTEDGEYDRINVSGGDFLVEGGTLILSIGAIGNGGYSFDFFEGTPISGGSFNLVQVVQDGMTFDLDEIVSGVWTYSDLNGISRSYSFNANTGGFEYEVVPEPETYALLIGAGAALWLARRRCRGARA